MIQKEQSLEGNVVGADLSGIDLSAVDATSFDAQNGVNHSGHENLGQEVVVENVNAAVGVRVDGEMSNDGFKVQNEDFSVGVKESTHSAIDENLFLDTGETNVINTLSSEDEKLPKYFRGILCGIIMGGIGLTVGVFLWIFDRYITQASQNVVPAEHVVFVEKTKNVLDKVKTFLGNNNVENYQIPSGGIGDSVVYQINEIINATDIDFIEKKSLLQPYVVSLVRDAHDGVSQLEKVKQDIAKQGFLPDELRAVLSDDSAIDAIQRSLNALEVIKFSTATNVFSYMDSALTTIAEMIRVSGASAGMIGEILNQLNSRGEKDISAYVYMCYLNPFETNANCDTVGDLDLYYNSIIKDNSINVKLFKNVMNAINQLLENEDTALFSIMFDGFQAKDKTIAFKVDVYTNQNDERNLMAKGKKNPNIFILKNIINLLKQSSFVIGSEINTKEVNVSTKTISLGGLTTTVNYSTMDFTVPIQKDTEREIFDYIDLENLQKLLSSSKGYVSPSIENGLESLSNTTISKADDLIVNSPIYEQIDENSYE